MARKRKLHSKVAWSGAADDLKRIHGIGPSTEQRLHSAGIHTFTQFAALSEETIASLVPQLSLNRVKKQAWVSQARKMASGKPKVRPKLETVILTGRQHYENFTLEFLLDENKQIQRLRMVHVQSGDVDTWAEWNTERLVAFLAWHTGACLPHAKPVMPTILKTEYSPAETISPSPPSRIVEEITSVPQISVPTDHELSEAVSPHTPPLPASSKTSSPIRLLEWRTLLAGTNQPVRDLFHDQAFDVRLRLDLSHASLPDEPPLDFATKLYAKKMGGGCRQRVSETQCVVPFSSTVNLTIRDVALPRGLYRLEAFLTLISADLALMTARRIEVVFPGGLIQIY